MDAITFKVLGVPDAFRERTRSRLWLKQVARDHGHRIHQLNFVLMDDEALLAFNQQYLGHDAYTDIITFDGQTGAGVSGDVLMSYDRIRENAVVYGVSTRQELLRVMVHGLLHLLGYQDKTATQQVAMRKAEDKFLALYRHVA